MNPAAEITRRILMSPEQTMHDVCHLLKVHGYAKTIGELEHLDPRTLEILECAAIVHDIACPSLRARTGQANGHDQQIYGPPLARDLLQDTGLDEAAIDRVCFLVAHHHTVVGVDGLDWQILLEADYLVNADEGHASPENIRHTMETMFKTKSGTELLKRLYGI